MKKRKLDKVWIVATIFIILFILWTIFVLKGYFISLDYQIFDFIHQNLLNRYIMFFLKGVTNLADLFFILLLIIIAFCCFKRKLGTSITLNAIMVSLLNLLLKNIFMIARPDTFNFIKETGFSYPSGHAMISLAFYGFIIYLIYKKMKDKHLKCIFIFLFVLCIFLIGFSRIYLGVHHFSDIIGGYLISFAYLLLFIKLVKKLGLVDKNEI